MLWWHIITFGQKIDMFFVQARCGFGFDGRS
jgi:hypothetical protein